jgi:hypothetical protein
MTETATSELFSYISDVLGKKRKTKKPKKEEKQKNAPQL